ncbi:MAG: chorismate mutase [Dethiobacteria bacterium]
MQGVILRGIRGAIDVSANESQEILKATKSLLQEMARQNLVKNEDIAAIFFTVTADLNATFPAAAARQLGWSCVPLMCSQEIDVPGSLPRCIRVLMLVNSRKTPEEVRHIYLKGAATLREDLIREDLSR